MNFFCNLQTKACTKKVFLRDLLCFRIELYTCSVYWCSPKSFILFKTVPLWKSMIRYKEGHPVMPFCIRCILASGEFFGNLVWRYTQAKWVMVVDLTHRVISDRVHRLLVTLSYFRPDRFVQLLSLIPILILLLYLLVSGCLTSLC